MRGREGVFPDQACFIIRCKNLALNIRDCLSLCLSEETVKTSVPSIGCLCQGK